MAQSLSTPGHALTRGRVKERGSSITRLRLAYPLRCRGYTESSTKKHHTLSEPVNTCSEPVKEMSGCA